jgi:hypothetical protein
MNTTDWFVFIQQEHYVAPKCFAGLLWFLPIFSEMNFSELFHFLYIFEGIP